MICSRLNIFESFSTVPGSNESDLRTLYCAFAISSMLNDWSGVDVPRALAFVATCRVRLMVQRLEKAC
jgi:prenyltransferase beta subunit